MDKRWKARVENMSVGDAWHELYHDKNNYMGVWRLDDIT